MNKLPICTMCKKIKVTQQEWKTKEEKEICCTCYSFKKWCEDLALTLQISANEKNLNRKVFIVFKEVAETYADKLYESVFTHNEPRVVVVDKKKV